MPQADRRAFATLVVADSWTRLSALVTIGTGGPHDLPMFYFSADGAADFQLDDVYAIPQ